MTSLMNWFRRLRARLRYGRFDDDLRLELEHHRTMSEESFRVAGQDAAAARRSAALALGNVTLAREQARGVWLAPWLDQLGIECRHALRGLRRAPAFTALALTTLALGIGANIVVFAVVRGVLLRPLPYPDANRLVSVQQASPSMHLSNVQVSPSEYFVFREQSRTLQDVAIYLRDSATVTGSGTPERVTALDVTVGLLPGLRAVPTLGRIFSAADDSPGTPATVIVTDDYWRSRLSADRSAIGRNLIVNGQPREIVGVLPRNFRFLDMDDLSLLLPMQRDRSRTFLGQFNYSLIARLGPGVTPAQADAEVAALIPLVNRTFPASPGANPRIFDNAHLVASVRPLAQDIVGDVSSVLRVLMTAIGIVLLIACANVANLLLVRAAGRWREVAVRMAVGATRARVAAIFLVESGVLAIAGGAIGTALAALALRLLVAAAPAGLPRRADIRIDGLVLAFALASSLLAGLLSAAVPLLKHVRLHAGAGLRDSGRTASHTPVERGARDILVVVQVALALVVLVGSGLMIRTFDALAHVTPGFVAPEAVQTFRLAIPESEATEPRRVVAMERDIDRALATVPGVTDTAWTTALPMDGAASGDPVLVEGRAYAEGQLPPLRRFTFVSPGYFKTLGIPLLAGRDFDWSDLETLRPVAIVAESVARDGWQDARAAVGKRIRLLGNDTWHEVIGVVADVKLDGLAKDAPLSVYWPVLIGSFWGSAPFVRRDAAFAMRTPRAGSEGLLTDIQAAVWSVNPNLPLASVQTLDVFERESVARTSFTLVMLLVAGSMALVLGLVGLYSVTAYAVAQRTRELGIRAALGARPGRLVATFVRQAVGLAACGLVLGWAAALGLTTLMKTLLFGVTTTDAVTYAAAGLLIAGTAALASYVPARRALRIDPARTLRADV